MPPSKVCILQEPSVALGEVRRLIDTATIGDGTVGRLLNDRKLFNNLVRLLACSLADSAGPQ